MAMMPRGGQAAAALVLPLLLLAACAGARAARPLPDAEPAALRALGRQALARLAPAAPEAGAEATRLARVGRRLATASRADVAWTFGLLADRPGVEVLDLPGGAIGVPAGLLGVVDGEDGLAAAVAHAMGHVLAGHTRARLVRALRQAGHRRLPEVPLAATEGALRAALLGGLGLADGPAHGPQEERAADELGLRILVRAGYNPHEAVRLLARRARRDGGGAAAARAARLARLLPRLVAEERAAMRAEQRPGEAR